jgi:glycine C-acetyltransferase/8-amino-7-oxononanoate synthase
MSNAIETTVGPRVVIDGRERDYFAGCSYLGLQNHPDLIAAAAAALQRYGLGIATSRGGYGEHPVYVAVEDAAARHFSAEAALYYVTAYLGNTILLQGLRGEYDRVFMDDASHFSVRDGVQLTGVPATPFRHLDPDDLAAQLRAQLRPGQRPLVISDGVFPISGEIAPAPDYLRALAAYPGAILCLDDAHATGVLGDTGQGTAEYWENRAEESGPAPAIAGGLPAMMHLSLQGGAAPMIMRSTLVGGPDPVIGAAAPRRSEEQAVLAAPGVSGVRLYSAHTLSKALGCHGGVLAGDAELIEKLRANAAAYVAHSPSPLPAAAAAVAALEMTRGVSALRNRLRANVARARAGLRALGWELADTPVPIICLGARPGLDLARIQAELFARDLCVAHVTRYSSTPAGGALRIAIFATHSEAQIDRLAAEVGRLL